MRDFGNVPVIAWDGSNSAMHARAQIFHAEPLILEMDSSFGINMEAGECGCRTIDEGDHYLGCSPKCTLSQLASDNRQPALVRVGEAAEQAGMLVDLDRTRARIIIYS